MSLSRLLLALVSLCVVAAGYAAEPARRAALVRVDEVGVRQTTDTVTVIGRLVASRAGTVNARVAGVITARPIALGDRVEAGQALAVLDEATLLALRDLAQARRAQAAAAVATRREEAALALQELRRLERLRGASSVAQIEAAQRNEAVARGRVREAEAAAAVADADLALAELHLGYATIRAPYAGVVTALRADVGGYLAVGQPVAELLSDLDLEVEAAVPYRRLADVAPGAQVELALDDGSRHPATVRVVLPEEDPLTRTRTLRLVPRFGATPTPLAAGQGVAVNIPVGGDGGALSVHKDAVIRRGETALVFVVRGEEVEEVPVRLGAALGSRFVVEAGLGEGDLVVVRGNERLRAGDRVRIEARP